MVKGGFGREINKKENIGAMRETGLNITDETLDLYMYDLECGSGPCGEAPSH